MLHKVKQLIPDLGDRLAPEITSEKLTDSLIKLPFRDLFCLTCLQLD